MISTITGARAAVQAIEALRAGEWRVAALQDHAKTAGMELPEPVVVASAAGVPS